MASQVSPPESLKRTAIAPRARDLRSPVSFQVRQGSFIGWIRIGLLLILDLSVMYAAWQIAQVSGTDLSVSLHIEDRVISYSPTAFLTIGVFGVVGLYREGEGWRDATKVMTTLLLVHSAIALTTLLPNPSEASVLIPFALFTGLSIVTTIASRFTMHWAIQGVRQVGVVRHPIFIFCQSDQAKRVVPILGRKHHYTVSGWNEPQQLSDEYRASTVRRLKQLGVCEVFLCAQLPARELMLIYWDLRNAGITLHICVVISNPVQESPIWQMPELYTATFAPPTIAGIEFQIKRCFDFIASVTFLLLTFPLYIVIAALIRLDSPGPIFFRQTRIGLQNRPFRVWKFRTMVVNAAELQKELESKNENRDGVLFKMKDDPRITRVGKFLRRYSLDELPQVFNILVGEMSFVGPRPLPLRDVEKFSEHDYIRHAVLPGITGMWQVSGRSNIDNFDDVLRLDMVYIKDWSLWLDLKIILQTVRVVLQKTGAY